MRKQLLASLMLSCALAMPALADDTTGPRDGSGPQKVNPDNNNSGTIVDGDRMLGNRDDAQNRQLSNNGDQKAQAIFDQIKQSPDKAGEMLFLLQASMANQCEIEFSKIVESKSNDQAVKELARMVRTDHEQAQQKVTSLARSMNLDLPDSLPPGQLAFYQAVGSLPPEQIDHCYLLGQKAAHAMAITAFADQQVELKNPAVKAYVTETLPKLREHGQAVAKLAKSKNIGSAELALGGVSNEGSMGNVDQSQHRAMDRDGTTDTNRKPTDNQVPR